MDAQHLRSLLVLTYDWLLISKSHVLWEGLTLKSLIYWFVTLSIKPQPVGESGIRCVCAPHGFVSVTHRVHNHVCARLGSATRPAMQYGQQAPGGTLS